MKKVKDIIGLAIISINKGVEVGKVKDTIINADDGAVDFIVIENDNKSLNTRIISSNDIIGVGEYAMTITDEKVIFEISKVQSAVSLLQRDIKVTGAKVLTRKGKLIGEIGDIFVDDENNLTISGLEYIEDITRKVIKIIPRESIITFGKELIVVEEGVEDNLVDNSQYLSGVKVIQDNIKRVEEIEITKTIENIKDKMDIKIKEEENVIGEIREEYVEDIENIEENEIGEQSPGKLFEEKQRQYLKGRMVSKNIIDKEGKVIINKGTEIDDEVIDTVQKKGKLVELVMNNSL